MAESKGEMVSYLQFRASKRFDVALGLNTKLPFWKRGTVREGATTLYQLGWFAIAIEDKKRAVEQALAAFKAGMAARQAKDKQLAARVVPGSAALS